MTQNKPQPNTPKIDWTTPQSDWTFLVRVPVKEGDLGGPSVEAHGQLCSAVTEQSLAANEHIVIPYDLEGRVSWCEDADSLICAFEGDGRSLVALRKATDLDRKRLRSPSFIQCEAWPMCCGRSMQFVGQIDDETICMQAPPNAQLWWHDIASFYVYTCSICLECKAIGQQF